MKQTVDNKKMRNRRRKFMAIAMSALMLSESIFPGVALALTGGPSQPEVEQFSLVGATDMVNLFTGDFNYNIPLLTVPGPNGGYPINLTYQGSPGVEDEASWVGLGWNINAGAVSRQKRGLADDWSGQEDEKIEEQRKCKPEIELEFAIPKVGLEVLGLNLNKLKLSDLDGSISLTYNNYTGVSIAPGINPKKKEEARKSSDTIVEESLRGKVIKFINDHSTEQERKKLKNRYEKSYEKRIKSFARGCLRYSGLGSGTASSAFPYVEASNTGVIKLGKDVLFKDNYIDLSLMYSLREPSRKIHKFRAYGTMYHQYGIQNSENRLDYSVEKQIPITRQSKVIPIPASEVDQFHVSGHGLQGTFKASSGGYRMFFPNSVSSENFSINSEASVSTSASNDKLGFGPKVSSYFSSMGPWKKLIGGVETYGYDSTSTESWYEDFYFSEISEVVQSVLSNPAFLLETAIRFVLDRDYARNNLAQIDDKYTDENGSSVFKNFKSVNSSERHKRNKVFHVFTNKELGIAQNHQIGKILIQDESGNFHEYGKPVYNNFEKQYAMSIPSVGVLNTRIDYVTSQTFSESNSEGERSIFNLTNQPKYAYSYMLTKMFSSDYVDVTGDGCSPDDLGDYFSFGYTAPENYRWRFPLGDPSQVSASKIPVKVSLGNLSTTKDDMGVATYGEKEITYLNRIDSKTHFAVFELENRQDGNPVVNESGLISIYNPQRRIKTISLYSKADPSTPIKTAHFEYNYELCPGTPNSVNTNGSNPNKGKLTLKKVYFTYGGKNTKSSRNAYSFNYNLNKLDGTPARYSDAQSDPWGSPDIYSPFNNYRDQIDHVDQYSKSDDQRINEAGIWSLSSMELPSGAKVKVNYESDEYSHVQNRKAMELFQVVGTTESIGNSGVYNSSWADGNLRNLHKYIVFKLPKTVSGNSTLADRNKLMEEMLKGVEDMYFKILVRLKSFPIGQNFAPAFGSSSNKAKDYVTGYCKVDKSNGTYGFLKSTSSSSEFEYGYVKIKDNTFVNSLYHPMRLAAWQYLRVEREDLNRKLFDLSNLSGILTKLPETLEKITASANNVLSYLDTYYPECNLKGYARNMVLNPSNLNSLPSWIRLNTTFGSKYGGGSRVKSIEIMDNWYSMSGKESSAYRVEYKYTTFDGKTSGVAEYEPQGDENPFKLPLYQKDNRLVFHSKEYLAEYPLCESYYPSPNVGYSRVEVHNIPVEFQEGSVVPVANAIRNGVNVSEFYTAKDYPVITSMTDIEHINTDPLRDFVKAVSDFYNINPGFSQGFKVETNDMHGKEKAHYTYKNNAVSNENLTASVNFFYKSKPDVIVPQFEQDEPYFQLDNTVSIINGPGQDPISGMLGTEIEVIGENVEVKNASGSVELEINVESPKPTGTVPPITPVFSWFSMSKETMRKIATVKNIHKKGILTKVITRQDGSYAETENHVFDGQSGDAIISSVTNDYEKPVFSYQQPAYWNNERMGPNYKYSRLKITNQNDLQPGDVITWEGEPDLWVVNNIDKFSGSWNIINFLNGVSKELIFPNNGVGLIRRKENKLSSSAFQISYKNEFSIMYSILEKAIWEYNANSVSQSGHSPSVDFKFEYEPFGYVGKDKIASFVNDQGNMYFQGSNSQICTIKFSPMANYNGQTPISFAGDLKLEKGADGYWVIYNLNQPTIKVRAKYERCQVCMNQFFDKVLNLQAVSYSDVDRMLPATLQSTPINQDYRWNWKGNYKPSASHTILTDRTQTSNLGFGKTRTDQDGIFSHKVKEFAQCPIDNTLYLPTNKQYYNLNGDEIYNINALDQHSSVIMGYGNAIPLAVAQNAAINDILFESFEAGVSGPLSGTRLPASVGNSSIQSNKNSHTGSANLSVPAVVGVSSVSWNFNTVNSQNVDPLKEQLVIKKDKNYVLTVWVKSSGPVSLTVKDQAGTSLLSSKSASNGGTVVSNTNENTIEGWKRIEVTFMADGSVTDCIVEITGSSTILLDDMRIFPFDANMKSFVYDPNTLKLVAQLDENNYATYYIYDEEQRLIQVKKETEKGIITVQATKTNVKQ